MSWTHAALVLDGAGWHGSNDLVIPQNVTLIPHKLANRLYDLRGHRRRLHHPARLGKGVMIFGVVTSRRSAERACEFP